MTPRARAAWVVLALLLLGPPAPPARAGTEEFSTFDVARQEEDDESLLDHVLTRPPRAWRETWERAPMALTTSQGCLTSGQWFIDTRLKLRAPLGDKASLGFELTQDESDRQSFLYTDFLFRFPTAWGTPGAMFRPLFDKSRQDFGVFWEVGADTSDLYLRTMFTFEDTFNNLWAFRQTRVGEASEPYERHPFEPSFRFKLARPALRLDAEGQWLTPSRKRMVAEPVERIATLWGTFAAAGIEAQALGFGWELRGSDRQAESRDLPVDLSTSDARDQRRQWSVEAALWRRLGDRLTAEARWLYQERDQSVGPPIGWSFAAVDRMLQAEATVDLAPGWFARLGGLYDRITAGASGFFVPFTYGSRTESRAYVGLGARFGRVTVYGVEGIELDPEPYEVWLVHDKAFLHLQTTF